MKNKPNLFITGWTRSGTSSLHMYLKQHPEIFMSEVKEPRFFGDHPSPNYPEFFKNEKKYLSLFSKVKNEKILGEASHYFDSEIALKQIKKFNPKSKIIILLREPAELIYSEYKNGVIPNNKDLEVVLKKNSKEVKRLLKICEYYRIIKKHLEIFGKENVYIILSENLLKNPEEEFSRLCKFLNINSNFKPDFENYSVSREIKNKWFWNLIKKFPNKIKLGVKNILSEKINKKIRKKIRKFTTKKEIKKPIDPNLKDMLKKKFEKEIKKTEKLIGKNLSKWYN